MIKELKNILFLDIETVATTNNFNTLDERLKTQWQRKASYLKRETHQSDEDLFHERAGIYAEFGKIVCIAIGKVVDQPDGSLALKTKAFYGHSEKEILTSFSETIQKLPKNTLLCAHNGKEFDYPYLCRRMLINEVALPHILQIAGKKSWEVNHLDTLELWKFGDYKHFTSLDLLATIFNLPSSKNDMDGSKVNFVYYKEDNLEKIKNYCLADVSVLAQLYIKMKALPVPLPLLQINS
ncbi:MAG: 3'-5' exonuclease [Cyclobacteriaceae bacterium]|jgi:predicted PolB exonuclease-like 3'-5' exonuclease|nr:3'-5' exonuclease [Flammeovirgaceae bacterium]MCZ8020872.1 3'-5' exonuclease [Cytophagales bacterium]MCZ8328486.1 3'-5' exonuclease [Cyclobacteriaceae bacterium]